MAADPDLTHAKQTPHPLQQGGAGEQEQEQEVVGSCHVSNGHQRVH